VNGPSGPLVEAAAAARRGEPIVFPTDTVYGIGTRPDDPSATARIFEAKGRPRDLELPVLVASIEHARSIAAFDDRAARLTAALWPGPLTIVVPRRPASAPWDLGGDPDTVGVRIPRHPLALALLSATGPLAVTSANRSGEPPVTTCEGLRAVFGGSVAVYLCEDRPLEGLASTVVDLAHGPARILRRGALPVEAIRELVPEDALLDSPPSP
jgi:L-threonylcarbamoyladenylate synthase